MPSPTNRPGNDQAGDGEIEGEGRAAESAAEARPATTDNTTVTMAHAAASPIERTNEPAMSPTASAI